MSHALALDSGGTVQAAQQDDRLKALGWLALETKLFSNEWVERVLKVAVER